MHHEQTKKLKIFNYLNERLSLKILEYLTSKEFYNLAITNQNLNNLINNNPSIYNKESFFLSVPNSIDFYSPFSISDEFLNSRTKRIETILEIKTNFWKNTLISRLNIINKWKSLFEDTIPMAFEKMEETLIFIKNFFNLFSNPSLPPVSLKRENVGTYSETIFQNHLIEILYKGGRFIELDLDKTIIDDFIESEEIDLSISSQQKLTLLKLRWCIYENLDNNQSINEEDLDSSQKQHYFELSDKKNEESEKSYNFNYTPFSLNFNGEDRIIKFYNILYECVVRHTDIIHEYLLKQNNPYDLINEYCIQWNVFCCTMIEFEKNFKKCIEAINNKYEKNFEGYPNFPKFSIWRMMAKIWIKNCFSRLEQPLTACFKKILKVIREKNLSFLMKDQNIKNHKKNEGFDELPLNLYISFKKRNKKFSSFKILDFQSTEYESHDFFSKEILETDFENISSLLKIFLNCMIDLSLNEISVHYLGHSELRFDYPYKNYEKLICSCVERFYKDNSKIFFETPHLFQNFLDSDANLINNIFEHKMKNELEKIRIDCWLEFFKEFCCIQYRSIENKESLCDNNFNFNKKSIELLKEIISEETCDCNEIETNEENIIFKSLLNIINEKFNNKDPIYFYSQQKEYLYYLKTNKTFIDIELEENNNERNLPLFLEDTIETFYNLNRNFTIDFIEKIQYINSNKKKVSEDYTTSENDIPSLSLNKQSSEILNNKNNLQKINLKKFISHQPNEEEKKQF